jgi:hypothetical protein
VAPASGAQIDYGKLGTWWDPVSGRRVPVWMFATILSCPWALFVQPVLNMDQRSPLQPLRRAYRSDRPGRGGRGGRGGCTN